MGVVQSFSAEGTELPNLEEAKFGVVESKVTDLPDLKR